MFFVGIRKLNDRANRAWLRLESAAYRLREKTGEEEGQSLVEYAIAVALIALAAMAAIQALGGGIAAMFTRLLGRITGLG